MQRLKNNLAALARSFVAWWGGLTTLATVILSFITWDDLGVSSKAVRLVILAGLAVIAALVAIVRMLSRQQNDIFGDTNRGVVLRYGDIIKLGFPKKDKGSKIVVIPVNRCFDLSCEDNLVSHRSIHGQWIDNYINSETERVRIERRIHEALSQAGAPYDQLTKAEKCAGNLRRYRPGTVVELPGKNGVMFYLLALSSFDRDLKAHCTEPEFYETLQGLLEYYDAHGQAEDMYCPVMGDHIVRPTRDTRDIIHLMLSVFRFNRNRVHGKLHLVVYENMKADISILDY